MDLARTGGMAALVVACGVACSSAPNATDQRAHDAVAGSSGAGIAGSGGVSSGEPTDCAVAPALAAEQSARLSLELPIEFGGAPFALGDTMTDAQGGTYRVTFFSYYLGNFQLVDGAGNLHAGSLVGADEAPLPYGLLLVNVDDPESRRLRLAVAPGSYTALRFSVGVHQACDMIPLPQRLWPLSFETEMNWGWAMLHVRLEGFHAGSTGNVSFMYHLGFPNEYRTVTLEAPLDLRQGAKQGSLVLAVDHLLGADNPSVALDQPTFTDNIAAPGTFTLR